MHPLMEAAIEQHLADLSDEEWAALTARVRPPKQPISHTISTSSDVENQGS